MNDWDTRIRRATLDSSGKALAAATPATLEFCIQPPLVWSSNADGAITLRCTGWAVSHAGKLVRARLSDGNGVRKWVNPVRSRPDVMQHFKRSARSVPEFSGFDVLLELDCAAGGERATIEFIADEARSEPQVLDVGSLYRKHRASLGHDGPYLGVFEPGPDTRGLLELAAGERVSGWAQHLDAQEPVNVVLTINGEEMAETAADQYRQDLKRMRISESGRSAFEFTLTRPLESGDVVRVQVRNGEELSNSPLIVA